MFKIDLKNKKLLDVGGGNGIASFFVNDLEKSCECVIVDPLEDGSSKLMYLQYQKMSKIVKHCLIRLGTSKNIKITLQNYKDTMFHLNFQNCNFGRLNKISNIKKSYANQN